MIAHLSSLSSRRPHYFFKMEKSTTKTNGVDWVKLEASIRSIQEEQLPSKGAMERLVLEGEERISRADCKITYYKIRADASLALPLEEHEIRYWEGVKVLWVWRLEQYQQMILILEQMLKLPPDVNQSTTEDRQSFAALGMLFMELGAVAFQQQKFELQCDGDVVIEKEPDKDYWLAGAPLDHLDHCTALPDGENWLGTLQSSIGSKEIFNWKQNKSNAKESDDTEEQKSDWRDDSKGKKSSPFSKSNLVRQRPWP